MSEILSAPYVLEYTYTRSTGPVVGRFLESLRYEVLEGVKTVDGRVLCPPLEYDEEGEPTTGEFVELRPSGTVKSWSWVEEPRKGHPFTRPFAWALIQIDGTDNAMVHAVDAGKAKGMRTGMRVRLRWAETKNGTIRDIECFEPISPVLPGPVHLDYDVKPGEHYSAYLRGLKEGKLIGGRDPESDKVYVPPRAADPVTGKPTSEYVEVEDVGVLTGRNPAALGDAIASLLADDARRERLAAAGRARAEANFDYRSLIAELVTWLDRVSN